MISMFLIISIFLLIIYGIYQVGIRILARKMNKNKDIFNSIVNDINLLSLNIIHSDAANSIRNVIMNHINMMRLDIDNNNFNLRIYQTVRYHLNILTKLKISLESDINKINDVAAFILNRQEYVNNLNNVFNINKRHLNILCKKFDKIIIYKHLKNFTTDKKYYKENYIDVIETYFERANKSLCNLNVSDAIYNIEKVNDLTKIYNFEMNSVNELTETLYQALDNYRMYDDEVKSSRGSLYNKVLTKFQHLNYRNDDVIYTWNNIIKNIDIYNIIQENDYISKSNKLIYIISELRKLDMLLDVELDVQQENEIRAEQLTMAYNISTKIL